MLNLGLLAAQFPAGGDAARAMSQTEDVDGRAGHLRIDRSCASAPYTGTDRAIHDGCSAFATEVDDATTCSCQQRTSVPPPPSRRRCHLRANQRTKSGWLLGSWNDTAHLRSTPVRIDRWPLPSLEGPPIEIHIDEHATPRTCQTAATITLHWQQKVY